MTKLLDIKNLTVTFSGNNGEHLRVLHSVDLNVHKGEILGLVGESGSGKSLTCLATMRLLPENTEVGGDIRFEDQPILALALNEMPRLRGRKMAMIFQDPIGALNPVQTIGRQLIEALQINSENGLGAQMAREKAIQLLNEVSMPDPADRLGKYPHELSGGQNQRVMIAMMLAGNPRLLIADEPTTALDVTIQAQILRLLKRLRDQRNMAIILVTHDLGVVAETCDRLAVMYCGRIVETGTVRDVFSSPMHPYTHGLLNSRPRIDRRVERLNPIPGVVPMPSALPLGCSFQPRCPNQIDRCEQSIPELIGKTMDRLFACYHPMNDPDLELNGYMVT